jgi:hypothetical protein
LNSNNFGGKEAMQIDPLFAYIGPGSGLELVGAMIGLLVTLGTSASFIVLYPIRKFLRSRRGLTETAVTEEVEVVEEKRVAA